MTDYNKKLDGLVRLIGQIANAEVVEAVEHCNRVHRDYQTPTKRPHVAYELTQEGSTVRSCIEQYALDRVTEYAMREFRPITMEVKYTDQPIHDELIGDLWDKAYQQGIEDERTAATLNLEYGANRTNPYRSL